MRTDIKPVRFGFLAAAAVAALTLPLLAQERERAQIADRYKWNLADIYPSIEAWRAAKERSSQTELPTARASSRASWRSSPATLADALDTLYRVRQGAVARCYVYASMLADQDTRDSAHAGHAAGDGAARRGVRRAEASYIEPEILKIRQGDGRASSSRRNRG